MNATFLQPFVSYTTKKLTTFGVAAEATYDWENHQWSVPVNLSVSQLLKIGNSRSALPSAPSITPMVLKADRTGACASPSPSSSQNEQRLSSLIADHSNQFRQPLKP